MPSGHTDRSTVNRRRPLSPGMASLLDWLCAKGGLFHCELSPAERNQMRGLMDRGYVEPTANLQRAWKATEEGRKANAKA